ncbi:MAG: D-alanine--D-alanine ligase family protein [Bacillota bacterium]
MKQKTRVGIIFGGRSAEHEVSLMSARSVARAIDRERYEVVPIGITADGRWVAVSDLEAALTVGIDNTGGESVSFLSEPSLRALARVYHRQPPAAVVGEGLGIIDVVFPVLHGTYGEDGTIQGLLEMANIPYVGAGVLGSALGMDKVVQKKLLRYHGLPTVDFVEVRRHRWEREKEQVIGELEAALAYPVFVKPANLGSSVGISKVRRREELGPALDLAARYDVKLIVEAGVEAREIECSVLGNEEPIASLPGEIIPSHEFYDYEAKYIDNQSQLLVPAPLEPEQTETVRRLALQAFRALEGEGMARVDFFLEKKTGKVLINEVNTIPGFTPISMYPKLWEATGISYPQLIDRLLQLAVERHRARQNEVRP